MLRSTTITVLLANLLLAAVASADTYGDVESVCELAYSTNLQGAIWKKEWWSVGVGYQSVPDTKVVFIAEGKRIAIHCFQGAHEDEYHEDGRFRFWVRPDGTGGQKSLRSGSCTVPWAPSRDLRCGASTKLLQEVLRLAKQTLKR